MGEQVHAGGYAAGGLAYDADDRIPVTELLLVERLGALPFAYGEVEKGAGWCS
jgi:hypothetical protein